MDGPDSPKLPPDEEEEEEEVVDAVTGLFSGVRLTDAPILLLVYFHKAIRAELAELHRVAVNEAECGSHDKELILELRTRFEFLKLVYKYHCAAEDEVVFLALDAHIKHVACTYSLEHKSIDDLFNSIFHCLNVLMEEDENVSKSFQELVFCIVTIQGSICQHMRKEEEQVFPLLKQQFSSKEQASLVWQFICSVPVMLLEDFLPWMISFLSPEEQVDVKYCIKEIVPEEKSLQEVVISWLGNNNESTSGVHTMIGKVQGPHKFANMKSTLKFHSSKRSLGVIWHWKKAYGLHTNVGHNPVDDLSFWHSAIMKDLKEILDKLYRLRSSSSFSELDSITIQLKFLADVLTFYSTALEKFFYPVLNELSHGCLPLPSDRFILGSSIEGLQQLLHHNDHDDMPQRKLVEKLCWELESFLIEVSKQFAFQETEVFPVISKNCSHEMQRQLLYMSLHVMPLGLLKCMITWFSAHLSEDESRSILQSINQGDSLVNESFASLLYEWFQIGYSGKTSVENFVKNLQKMFKSRCSFLSEQIKEGAGSSSLHSDMKHGKVSNPELMGPLSANKGKYCLSSSSSGPHSATMYETSYSSRIHQHIFFPGTIKTSHSFPKFPGEKSSAGSTPIDLFFYLHKALKKDLEYLVFESAQLAENVKFLKDFCQQFYRIRLRFQIHSDAEDEIAFPALEAKGKLQNISHSYTIDHKLEVEHFGKISITLDEISELHISVSSVDSKTMLKYHQLCRKLHDMCHSMHKVLSDHIHREEIELWPLFREFFSTEEQEKIIQSILGRTKAEILQDMLPWLMAVLTQEEQHSMMSILYSATKNTMFDEWLGEWWEGHNIAKVVEEATIPPLSTTDPLEVISTYLSKEVLNKQIGGSLCNKSINFPQRDCTGADAEVLGKCNVDDKAKVSNEKQIKYECEEHFSEGDKKRFNKVADATDQSDKPVQPIKVSQNSEDLERLLAKSQEDLEAAIRRISCDSSLDPQKKSYMIQNLLMSRWIVKQQISHSEATVSSNRNEIPGQHPSYQDPLKLTFGCKHYKRNCKLLAACCNQLYTCIHCHDELADHLTERKSITKMMCMKCLKIQPIGSTCSTLSCNNFAMARYYCRICKLFDDEREIYHCPYCNLCRVGKGLGINYFHCMNCNACMSRSLSVHICREKSFMDNCPICHEDIFTSNFPAKALPCGHVMHSACFQVYTCTNYTCPICGKSLGDMQVYFRMLDALLAEEKIPDEYSSQTQVILCNDCEKRGASAFHWLYHKCSYCKSYNTRRL